MYHTDTAVPHTCNILFAALGLCHQGKDGTAELVALVSKLDLSARGVGDKGTLKSIESDLKTTKNLLCQLRDNCEGRRQAMIADYKTLDDNGLLRINTVYTTYKES